MTQAAEPAERPLQDAPPTDGAKDSQAVLAGAGYGMVGGVVQGVIRFATGLLTARALGAELLGVFNLSNRIGQLGATFSLSGQDDAVVHFVARHRGTGELGKAKGAFYVSVLIGAILSAIMGTAVYVFAPWLSKETFNNETMVPVIKTFSIAVPLSVLGGVLIAALRGTRDIKAAVITDAVVLPLSRLLLFAGLLLFGLKLFGLVFALLASLAIGAVYAGWHLRRTANWMQPAIRPQYEFGNVFRFSLPLIFLSLIDYVNNSSDTLIVGHYQGAAAAGVYGQALRVLALVKVPVSALSALFVPLCAELYGAGHLERLRTMFRATASCGIRFAVPAMFGVFLFAKPIMAMFGPDFVCGSLALSILASVLVTNCFAMLAGYAVYMSGRSWLVTFNQAFLALASVGLSLFLVPRFGIEGAATARAVSWALWSALILVQAGRLFGFRPFTVNMLQGIVAGMLCYVATWLLHRIDVVRENVVLLALSGVGFLALYVRIITWFGLTEDETYVLSLLGKRLQGVARKFRRA